MRMLRQRHAAIVAPSPLTETAVVVVDFEPDVSSPAKKRSDGIGVVVRRHERRHVDLGDLDSVDPGGDDGLGADDPKSELVPVTPSATRRRTSIVAA